MNKVILYIATTIDGKIARNDGSLDWLFNIPNPNQSDYGYQAFYDTIGVTFMGRRTYEEILGFGVEWPYQGIESYVISQQQDFSVSTPDTFLLTNDIVEFVNQKKLECDKDIWLIGGGELITFFLNHQLIDQMQLTIAPTIIGDGISLFPNQPMETLWSLSATVPYPSGIVTLIYDKYVDLN